jgi:hypothetical protein
MVTSIHPTGRPEDLLRRIIKNLSMIDQTQATTRHDANKQIFGR